jgi:hypothetical protein
MYELSQYNFPELVAEDDSVANTVEQQKANVPIIASKDTNTKSTVNKDSVQNKLSATVALKPIVDTSSNNIALTNIKGIVASDSTNSSNTIITPMKGIGKLVENKTVTAASNTISNSASSPNNSSKNTTPVAPKYPQNEKFKINQIAAVWAIAGESYLAIADKYNIPLYKLFRNNEIEATDIVQYDQIVFLNEKKNEGINKVHVVKKAETLYEISQLEGVKLSALKNYNQEIDLANIKEGMVLYLFKKPAEVINNNPNDNNKKTENKQAPTSTKTDATTEKKKTNKFKLF